MLLSVFSMPKHEAESSLGGYMESDWESILWWLDITGMALYVLDRLQQLQLEHLMPRGVEEALTRRLQKNQLRIKALQEEAAMLAEWFRAGRVNYALLKGASLTPESVPAPILRCQTDLDFLVRRRNVNHAMHYIRRLGYKFHARSGDTLEFRAGESMPPDILNLYLPQTQRALEIHLFSGAVDGPDRMTRRVTRRIAGAELDTLAPADILAQQALHLLKHLCSEHTRLSWVLEFWRHVRWRSGDSQFWREVHAVASEEQNGHLAIAVALWTAARMFGPFNMSELEPWGEAAIPPRILLWLERYVYDLLLADSVGSKLYALLYAEVPPSTSKRRSTSRILFPHYLPHRVMKSKADEDWRERVQRIGIEITFFLRRLGFHISEGVRFGIESARWRRALARCGQ